MSELLLSKALNKVSEDLQQLEQRFARLQTSASANTAEFRDLLGLIAKRKVMAQRLEEEIYQRDTRNSPHLRIQLVPS